jgi:hypothetical protein
MLQPHADVFDERGGGKGDFSGKMRNIERLHKTPPSILSKNSCTREICMVRYVNHISSIP